ncbi:MAG: response regulator [Deltaproteobacteria bacterium]|nr:response regulator [Deltaproteobacteria bacterium]
MEITPDATALVVDDEQDIRDACERILTRAGLRVLKASRGDEALSVLAKENVDIVLLDLKMPGMDGLEVLSRISAKYRKIQVIVITGYATVETAIEAMKQGAYDFIAKPFDPDQLRIVVRRAWEKIRLTREAEELERKRQRTLSDLDTEKSRIRTIIESFFIQLLGLNPDLNAGRRIEDYLPDEKLCNLVMEISRGKHVDFDDIPDYEFSLSDEKHFLASGQPVLGERKECLGAVLNIVDITAMKLLDQLKSEFVAKVSHELRSPLSTIHEQLAMVIKDMVGDDFAQDQHILARAREKTRGLISLIGDLLDLSRIEEGIICQELQSVRLEELLENIVDFLSTSAKKKTQFLALDLPENPLPVLTADPIALESIFGNLITNAINYTQDGGEIKVAVDMAGINVRVSVRDNGFGIADKYLDKIFERFYRVQDEKTRYITGTGLGLPIVKGLLDSIGGFISVESTFGKGSLFTVLLPVKSQAIVKNNPSF